MNCLICAAASMLALNPPLNVIHELTMVIGGPNKMSNRGYAGLRSASIGTGSNMGGVSSTDFFGATLDAIANRFEGDEIRMEMHPRLAGESIGEVKAVIVGGVRYDLYSRGGNIYSDSYGFYFRGEAGKFPPNGQVVVKFI